MKTKQQAIEDWLLTIVPHENKESAVSFAARTWEKYFRHIDFISWNTVIKDEYYDKIIDDAKKRSSATEEGLAMLMEHLGAFRKPDDASEI